MSTTLLALASGAAVGVLLGMLGGGGSILSVPLLVGLLGQNAHDATTISLIVVGSAAAAGAVRPLMLGDVRIRTALVMAAAGVPGSMIGVALNHRASQRQLLGALAVLIVIVAVITWRRADRVGSGPDRPPRASRMMCGASFAVGIGLGMLTGFFGVGGGFLIVPTLALLLRLPMRQAVGTSLAIMTLLSLTSFLIHVARGDTDFDWGVALPFTAATILFAVVGSHLGGRVPPAALARGFAVFLIVVAGSLALQM